MSKQFYVKQGGADVAVEVISKNGGWTTVSIAGKTTKVRNGALFTKDPGAPASAPAPEAPVSVSDTSKKDSTMAKRKTDGRLVKADLTKYHSNGVKTASGRKALDVNDSVAKRLRGMDIGDIYGLAAKATDRTEKELRERYKKLNLGMQRMNLGNLIRGASK